MYSLIEKAHDHVRGRGNPALRASEKSPLIIHPVNPRRLYSPCIRSILYLARDNVVIFFFSFFFFEG